MSIVQVSENDGEDITSQLSNNFSSLPFSVPENIEMILFLGFFSSGTEGKGFKLWLADKGSLLPVLKMVLLILTGGAGGLSSSSPLSDMIQNYDYGLKQIGKNLQLITRWKIVGTSTKQ